MARKSKFGNIRCELDGYKFDSRAEMKRYCQLRQLVLAGEISELRMQVRYPLEVCGHHICTYIADFVYRIGTSGETVTEDVKGGSATITDVFRIKAKLMNAVYGINISIVKM